MKKKVAILGAGFSGIGAIKSCLEEDLEPTCFEQYDNIGGVWYYTKEFREGQGASAFDSLSINGSKEMTAFSDFPFPKELPQFLQHRDVHEYMKSYVRNFGLEKYIHLKTKVTKVTRSLDYDVTGAWEVETVTNNVSPKRQVFDFVMVCTGVYKKAFTPDINGIESFKGDIQHSIKYRSGEEYKDKRVLVVGNGNSAGDMAASIAPFADQIFLSVGKGCWIVPKSDKGGVPSDQRFLTRYNFKSIARVDKMIYDLCSQRLDVQKAGCFPPTPPTLSRIAVTDEIQSYIQNGKIKIHGRLVRLGPREAEFDDGSVVHDLDAVLFATGYRFSLDYLDEPIIEKDGKVNLYKMIFPIHLPRSSMAMIGCILVIGPNPVFYELQSRLAVRVFVGKKKLPAKQEMTQDVDRLNQMIFQIFGYYKYYVPHFPLHDEIAAELGVMPSWLDLIKIGPKLAYNFLYGPAFPYQDRLWGPHPWSGAKDALYYAIDHGYYAQQPRKGQPPKDLSKGSSWLPGLFILAASVVSVAVVFRYARG